MHSHVKPLILSQELEILQGFDDIMFYTSGLRKINLKAKTDDLVGFMKVVEKSWEEAAPGQELDFFLLMKYFKPNIRFVFIF